MKNSFVMYLVALIYLTAHGVPSFSLTNKSNRTIYFIICGANDLLTIKNLKLVSPTIYSLKPGQTYTENISLKGHLDDKKPLLYLYPKPQGEQEVFSFTIDIKRDNIHQTIICPYADERVYSFVWGKNIYIELTAGNEVEQLGPGKTDYYKGLALRSLANDRGELVVDGKIISNAVTNNEMKRAWNYEKFGRWAREHMNEFSTFITYIDHFVYRYLQTGGMIAYLWRYGAKGISTVAKVRRAKANIEKKAGVVL